MFFLFAWPDYEARGGTADYIDTFPTLEAAIHAYQQLHGDCPLFTENGTVVTLQGERLITVWESSDNGR